MYVNNEKKGALGPIMIFKVYALKLWNGLDLLIQMENLSEFGHVKIKFKKKFWIT